MGNGPISLYSAPDPTPSLPTDSSMPDAESSTLPFPSHARVVARALRGTFSELIVSAGADPRDPQSIGKRLGLNKNLAWKLSKIVQADDPFVALEAMPGGPGVRIFFEGVERAGVAEPLIATARDAVREYEELIRVHSGDRATLEMMGSELSEEGREQRDEQHRKLLYQGASYVWGAQAKTILKIGIVGPGREPGLLDIATMSGLIDFKRLRPNVSWVMAARHMNNDDGTRMASVRFEAVDPAYGGEDRPPLVAEFCSRPLPELRSFTDRTQTCFELVEGPVGNTGALTCVVGTIQRNIPARRTPENEWGEHTAKVDTPAELLIVDMYFHKDFAFAIPPEVGLFSELGDSITSPSQLRDRRRLPLNERLQDLGEDPLPLATPEVARYGQMVRTMFERTGWSPKDFHAFRMRVPFPAYPTALVFRYRLPEA